MKTLLSLPLALVLIFGAVSCDTEDDANNAFNNTSSTNNVNNTTATNNTNNNAGLLYGTLTVSATTASYHGMYAPANVAVLWIMKADGTFVQTLYLAQRFYGMYLDEWLSDSGWDDTDAVTQASRMSHGTITGTWNLNGVEPGEYEFWAEFTEDNRAGRNDHGTITLDGTAVTATAEVTTTFPSLTATFTPAAR